MTQKIRLLLISLLFLGVVLLVKLPFPVRAETPVSGEIRENTTWTLTKSPYIVTKSVYVLQGITLTIEPGVTIKFDSKNKLEIRGRLLAKGSPSQLIIFTANITPNRTNPQPGDWGNIDFTATSFGNVLAYCEVKYGGEPVDLTVIHSYLVELQIDHCQIHDNFGNVYVSGIQGKSLSITNSKIYRDIGLGGGGLVATQALIKNNEIFENGVAAGVEGFEGGGILALYSTVTSNSVHHNSARHGGGLWVTESKVEDNQIFANTAEENGGDIFATGNSKVFNNLIKDNLAIGQGGGAYIASDTRLTNNVVRNNTAYQEGGGVYLGYARATNNIVILNQLKGASNGKGAGLYADGPSEILNNSIACNQATVNQVSGGLAFYAPVDGLPKTKLNSVWGNRPYEAVMGSLQQDNLNVKYNYWGTTESQLIDQRIYDHRDDSNLGWLLFKPFLLQPDSGTPPLPSTCDDLTNNN